MSLRARWAGLGLGAITLIWIQIEDVGIWYVAWLTALWCGWAALQRGKEIKGKWKRAGWGGLAGLAVTPLALFLVAVKGGLHGHGFSDLTVSQLKNLVGLSGWWVGAGLIAGALLARMSPEGE